MFKEYLRMEIPLSKNNFLINLFVEFIQQHSKLSKYIPILKLENVRYYTEQVNVDIDKNFVVNYRMDRYKSCTVKAIYTFINELTFLRLSNNVRNWLDFEKKTLWIYYFFNKLMLLFLKQEYQFVMMNKN